MEVERKINRVPAERYSEYMCDYLEENPGSTLFNFSMLYRVPKQTDIDKLARAFKDVCLAHPMLLSVFEKNKDRWDIVFKPEVAREVEIIELPKANSEEYFDELKTKLVKPFKNGECIYRCKIFKAIDCNYFFFDIYHAAIDGSGHKIFHRDLGRAFVGESIEKDRYFECRIELEKAKQDDKYKEDKDFLDLEFGQRKEYMSLPKADSTINGDSRVLEFEVPEGVKYTNKTSLRAVLHAMAEYNECEKVMCTWTYHARDDEDKKNCIGLFIRDIPIRLDVEEDSEDSLRKMCEEGLNHRGYQWSLTCERQLLYTAFQRSLNTFEGIPGIECECIDLPVQPVKADNPMDIEFKDDSKGRRFTVRYDSGMFKESSIRKFGKLVQNWYKNDSI